MTRRWWSDRRHKRVKHVTKVTILCTVSISLFNDEQIVLFLWGIGRSKRQQEGFSQAYSGRRMPQVASRAIVRLTWTCMLL
jgi:hypothetical protein